MKISHHAVASPSDVAGKTGEPSTPVLVLIFWAAFAAVAAFMQAANPEFFARTDPDSVLRLVQVRDLLAGQDWFDLVQHRMNAPHGTLMHWSRLIDAPLAGLVLLGNQLSLNGELVALTLWPLLVLLVMMAGAVYAAIALGSRAATLPALLMALTFPFPLAMFVPGSIDHHNAQIALTLVTLAFALRCAAPLCGLAAGIGAAVMLAIGLETLIYVAIIGGGIAAAWGLTGTNGRGTAYFGMAFAVAPAGLYLLTGSPEAATACDSLSWPYAATAAAAGAGLAALTWLGPRMDGLPQRMLALILLALLAVGVFLLVAPECRYGPYGMLSAEFNSIFLRSVSEAQPLLSTFARDPAEMLASVSAPLLACIIAIRRAWADQSEGRHLWLLPALLIVASVLLSFHQQRAIPYANVVAIPVLAAWVGELAVRYGITSLRPLRRAWPVVAAFMFAMPLLHLGLGLTAVRALSLATGGRIAPAEPPRADAELAGVPFSQRECVDAAAATEFSRVQNGIVLAPLFYGSSVLALSAHRVVAAPYHRAEAALLDTVDAFNSAPQAARRIVSAHAADYIAICTTAREVSLTAREEPAGLLARLLAGEDVDWLQPLAPSPDTPLRLYRVREAAAGNTQRADTM